METIEGVAIYPIVSLLIFFSFRRSWFWCSPIKETITELSQIPLRELNSLIFKIYKMKN
jgi:hypothetical protein